jgi:hypothetical protein
MDNKTTAKYPVAQRVQALILDWAEELSGALGRPVEEIRQSGLSSFDFPAGSQLHVRLMDGSTMQFRYAFHLVRKSDHALAIFTEHCGYHVFPLHDAEVSRVNETSLYRSSDEG